jgi:tRNA uridine 5-carbamoylmethylation protein Kti12
MNQLDATNSPIKTCLILVCGPPGIGKSTFCTELNAYIKTKSNHKTFLISYDDLIDPELESSLIGEHQNDWKSARNMIFQLVKSLVAYLNQSESKHFEDFLSVQDRFTSTVSMTETYDLIKQGFLKAIIGSNFNENSNCNNLIFLDDLFYYESMRYSFYKLAIELKCAYMSFCFKAENLNFLISRNFNRDHAKKLDQKVIENIFEKFEYSNRNEWESFFSRVELINESFRIDKTYLINSSEFILNKMKEFGEFLDTRKLAELIQVNHQNDEKALKLVHECDLVLRKLISEKISTNQLDKKVRSIMGQELSKKKSKILNEIKLDLNGIKTRLLDKVFDEDLEKRLVLIENEIKILLEH